jgi:CBS domain-containing protein
MSNTQTSAKTLRDIPLRQIPVVEPQTSVDEARRLLDEEPLRAVALVGDQMYMGLFDDTATESELVPPGADPTLIAIGPYVHPARVVGTPEMSVEAARAQMARKGARLLPIVRNRTFLGVVTLEDVSE